MSNRPKLIIWTDVAALGGVGEFNHSIALAMRSRGYEVVIVAPDFRQAHEDEERNAGILHIEVQLPERQLGGRPVMDVAAARKLLQELAPDVVLFADGCEFSNVLAKKAAADLDVPMIFSFGLVLGQHLPVHLQQAFAETLPKADAVVAVSHQNAQLFQRAYPPAGVQPTVIRYGRPERFFAPMDASRRAARRNELGANTDDVLFFTAARYEQIKGYDIFLAAVERLSRDPIWKNIRLAWAGGGPLESEFRSALHRFGATDRVHILGPRDDIDIWLEAADAFVLSSYYEGMPLAIMEAMAKGLPVIATAVGGVPEQLGDAGVLLPDPVQLPRSTVRDLARAITALTQSTAERERLGAQARQRAEALFREGRMAIDYARLIESATRASRGVAGPHDYVSPDLAVVRLDAAFPNMIRGNTGECDSAYLHREIMHCWYVDRRFPAVGFLSRDEAHILYNAALRVTGKRALEIGCFMGWSTCHLAVAGIRLDVIDPLFANPIFRDSVEASLAASGARDNVNLVAGRSPDAVHALADDGRQWNLIFIDGDHDGTAPLRDAAAIEPYTAKDCIVLFHNLAVPTVAEGLRPFKEMGWNIRIYRTMQVMAAAWRGSAEPPDHTPDPAIAWSLPLHLADLVEEDPFARIQARCKSFTMTSIPRQFVLHRAVQYIVENGITGDVVECGVWRGGSMMIAALTLVELNATDRNLVLYDTFAGMTEPGTVDIEITSRRDARGLLAAAPRSSENHYWAVASLDAVKQNMARTNYPPDRIQYVVGDVCETLTSGYPRPIALLRLDTDWYASTRCELERLFDLLQPGGVLIIDDYGCWAGAQKACDEFFAKRPERLHPIPDDPVGRIAVKGVPDLPPALRRRLQLA